MKITNFLKKNRIYFDGGTGSILQSKGLRTPERSEEWNITHPDIVTDIHRAYFDLGCNVVCTNTFGANLLNFDKDRLSEIIKKAVYNAKRAKKESKGTQHKWIALDIGPTGRMLKPFGDLDFERAVEIFAETVRLGTKYGADLIFIETMTDSYETKAALLAAKENSNLPVFVSNAYGSDGKLMTGATPAAMVAMLEGMGADAIGVNCSLGPDALSLVVDEYIKYSSLPIIVKPNAGLPLPTSDGGATYEMDSDAFAQAMARLALKGARVLGGCCGTTPKYISKTIENAREIPIFRIEKKQHTLVSSYARALEIGDRAIVIGERINPTGKPRFREAVASGDISYVLSEAIGEEAAGAEILDVNLGMPGVNEAEVLSQAIGEIQAICALPLQIDTSDVVALEKALRIYNGKAMINSVNAKRESMDAVFPLAKKYGGVIVALTLDENGIPSTAEERLEIARRILFEAKKYGIDKKDIVFDPLAMAVSADPTAAGETLRALRLIRDRLGCHTVLGISNVSYGLPNRDAINATFLSLALNNGLSLAIINPLSQRMMQTYHSFLALSGSDAGFYRYLSFMDKLPATCQATRDSVASLSDAIIKGLKTCAGELCQAELKGKSSLEVINGDIIPALNEVGEGYEQGRVYLPSLLASAEAAKAAFEVIKAHSHTDTADTGHRIILATVKGDVHDIGKNIVRLILENYGYAVTDLGKDVSPDKIVSEAIRLNARVVGLSALMTTTLPAMEETVRLLRTRVPDIKIMVGGAVLTEEYATSIGADFYGRDAMDAIRKLEKALL